MKKYNIILLIFFLSIISCQKEIKFDKNPSIYHAKTLIFSSLEVTNPVITSSTKTLIKAIAEGEELTYTWSARRGTIEGSGIEIQYSDTIIGIDTITCDVKDKSGKIISRQVTVTVSNDLIFSSLSASDTLLPLSLADTLIATASGEDITYSWSATGGTISGNGAKVTFTPSSYGDITVTCTVTDKYNREVTKTIILTVTNQLIFKSLTASPSEIHPNEPSVITAVAYGEGLTYSWTQYPPVAQLYGSGSQVTTTICHNQNIVITCTVKDINNVQKTKSVTVILPPEE